MNIPPSLPLAVQLAVDDFEAASNPIKQRLTAKLKQLHELEESDFTDNPDTFRKYAAIRAEVSVLIDFVTIAELTIEALCEILTQGPRLQQYCHLWIANAELTRHNQRLEESNDILTDLLLNHYENTYDKRTNLKQ
ncbi:hypothetical protein QNI19_28095 [Cytophagaceae bacterium DM2B3-1]|uniref:Uncharacterized protein n=1 Tax=Xanthocytophaga flava TaxID=3048013 RepID=A0ABT7CSW1_9BACT|nr:hypothetical protein [Xanthocytophaga flavus]MDJ1471889.1 hypothetical protein [Xanthocytophaga flavus]MDJ1496829.1 hypothetical protein [Xanthocytophaga flavus]